MFALSSRPNGTELCLGAEPRGGRVKDGVSNAMCGHVGLERAVAFPLSSLSLCALQAQALKMCSSVRLTGSYLTGFE